MVRRHGQMITQHVSPLYLSATFLKLLTSIHLLHLTMTDSNDLKLNCLLVGRKVVSLDIFRIRINRDATVEDLVVQIKARKTREFEGVNTDDIEAWNVTQFGIQTTSTTLKDDIEKLNPTNKLPVLMGAWELWEDVFKQALPLKGKVHILVESRRPSE